MKMIILEIIISNLNLFLTLILIYNKIKSNPGYS